MSPAAKGGPEPGPRVLPSRPMRAPPALVVDVWGRRVLGVDAADVVRTLLATAYAYEGPRDRLGPYCAWQAEQVGALVDPSLPDESAARALLDALLAAGEATVPSPAPVLPLRAPRR